MAENKEEKVECEDKPIVDEGNDVPQESEEVESVEESKQSTTQNDTIEQIDIGVIGGGIAGVYAAYRLKQQHPGKKIYIYEATGQLGGNQYSPPDNANDMAWLKGALHTQSTVVAAEHVLTSKLVGDTNVELLPPEDLRADANFFDYNAKSEKLADVVINNNNKYSAISNDTSTAETPREYMKNALDSFFQEFPEENYKIRFHRSGCAI